MGSMFGKEKPLKEIVRENQRMLRKAIRELEKEVESLKRQDKKLEGEIKKSAKMGQMTAAKIMAKDLVRTRNYVTRFIEMKTHLNAVSLKMQTIKSHDAMASAMKGVTKALISMNSKMNIPGLQKVMAEFLRENERAELTQEALADTLDDAMAEEGSSEQEDLIVNKVSKAPPVMYVSQSIFLKLAIAQKSGAGRARGERVGRRGAGGPENVAASGALGCGGTRTRCSGGHRECRRRRTVCWRAPGGGRCGRGRRCVAAVGPRDSASESQETMINTLSFLTT